MTFSFNEEKHEYKLDGKKIPSVTSIIGCLNKPGLDWWGYNLGITGTLEVLKEYDVDPDSTDSIKNVKAAIKHLKSTPRDELNKTARRGTEVHKAFEHYVEEGEFPQVSDAAKGYVLSMKKFLDEYEPEIIGVEERIYSPTLKVAGTFDALMKIEGKLHLCDWKTSKSIYSSHEIQVRAYEDFRQELKTGKKAIPTVLRLKASGRIAEMKESRSKPGDFAVVYNAWELLERLK